MQLISTAVHLLYFASKPDAIHPISVSGAQCYPTKELEAAVKLKRVQTSCVQKQAIKVFSCIRRLSAKAAQQVEMELAITPQIILMMTTETTPIYPAVFRSSAHTIFKLWHFVLLSFQAWMAGR